MRMRAGFGALFVGFLVAVTAVPAGAARVPPVTGTVECAMHSTTVGFVPGLQDKETMSGSSRGRGPSSASWSAQLGACGDGSAGAAPSGIDHATFTGSDKIPGSHCESTGRMKFVATITWLRADSSVVGTSTVKMEADLTTPGFSDPIVVTMTGTVKKSFHFFPSEPLSASLSGPPDFGYSVQCFKFDLASLGFDDTSVSIGV